MPERARAAWDRIEALHVHVDGAVPQRRLRCGPRGPAPLRVGSARTPAHGRARLRSQACQRLHTDVNPHANIPRGTPPGWERWVTRGGLASEASAARERRGRGAAGRRAPASLTSGRASSLMGGMGGGRYSCSTRRRSGENDRLGSGGRSTTSRISWGGCRYPAVGRSRSPRAGPGARAGQARRSVKEEPRSTLNLEACRSRARYYSHHTAGTPAQHTSSSPRHAHRHASSAHACSSLDALKGHTRLLLVHHTALTCSVGSCRRGSVC